MKVTAFGQSVAKRRRSGEVATAVVAAVAGVEAAAATAAAAACSTRSTGVLAGAPEYQL